MDRSIIEKTIDHLLHLKGVTVVKCKPSYRPHVLKVLQEYADKYGYNIQTYKDKSIYNKDALATLYDPVHNTMIEFNKDFINNNNIDWNNTDKKKINIEDIFNAYETLPDKCKDSMGLLKHTTEDDYDIFGNEALGWSSIYEQKDNTFNVVNIPSSFLENYTGENINYDFLLAHESMHCVDFHKFTQEEMDLIVHIKNEFEHSRETGEDPNITDEEIEAYNKVRGILHNEFTNSSISITGEQDDNRFFTAMHDNAVYINGGLPDFSKGEHWGDLSDNKASDYGVADPREDYAEFGAMVITGLHNKDNPESRVQFNGEWMQYREWEKLHPYQVQYFAKELYDEDINVEDIVNG